MPSLCIFFLKEEQLTDNHVYLIWHVGCTLLMEVSQRWIDPQYVLKYREREVERDIPQIFKYIYTSNNKPQMAFWENRNCTSILQNF